MKQRVVVTAIGSASADAVIKSLSSFCYIVGTNIYPKEYVATSPLVDIFYEVSTVKDREKYINEIIDICKKEKCSFIIPLTDPEVDVLNEFRGLLHDNGITLCISDKEVINICRNKRLCAQFLTEKEVCYCIPEINPLHHKYEFPIVVKVVNGRSSEGLEIIKDPETYNKFLNENYDSKKYMIQPYIDGTIVTVDVLRKKEECIVTMREEILRTSNGLGLTVKIFDDPEIKRTCIEIATALDIRGCVCFEFIRDTSGKLWFLECNPRFSGGINFSIIAGYDYPKNHMKCFLNESLDTQYSVKNMFIARKYEEIITG